MDDRLKRLLRERFGLDDFRGTQREVVDHLLAGGDAIVVWPTGSGKSLVYQLVALAQERPVLVLSPLIALMEDQVASLARRGIAATFVNSTVERGERERRAAGFAAGRWRLLYVTPERFRDPAFVAAISATRIGLLAVDEAHCITTWGHDFRPEYGRVGAIRARLGDPPTVALTATATPAVLAEIRAKLRLEKARLDHQGLARPNLFLAVTIVEDEAGKWKLVAERLEQIAGAGIVYGALIRDLHRLEEFLIARRARAGGRRSAGDRLLIYHGELSREERRAMHERFHGAAPARVLATRAFGMGIDRRDLRLILHHQVPGSLEELWQEVGRAGRDGRPSWCELLYCEQDLAIQMQFVKAANPDRRLFRAVARRIQEWNGRGESFDLERLRHAVTGRAAADGRVETCLSWLAALGATEGSIERGTLSLSRPLTPDEEPAELGSGKERRDLERLQQMVAYVRARECRRALLADHFGVTRPAVPCGACDVCADGDAWRARELAKAGRDARVSRTASRAPVEAAEAARGRAPERGDFVRVDGRLLGRVVRVSGRGRDAQVEVELSQSLEVRRFPARRHRIEVLQR